MANQMQAVIWRDSVQLGGWQYKDEMSDWSGRVITTVGYVVKETNDDLIMAMSVGDAGRGAVYCNWTSIPKCAIHGRFKLVIETPQTTE